MTQDEISDKDPPKTYAIWWFLALFVAMVGFGIYAVIAWGTYAREPTEALPGTTVTTDPGATTTSSSVPVTLVDGTPAQADIVEVLGRAGEYVYRFAVPEELSEVATESVVPEVGVERSDGDRTLTLELHCAVSAGSVPKLVRVTEDPFEVNVTPVVIGERLGDPCPEGAVVGTARIVLEEPVGVRRLVIAPPGTKVEEPGSG